MLKSLAGGGEDGVDPLPQPMKLPIHTQIHTVANARAAVAGRRYSCIVRVPNSSEKIASLGPDGELPISIRVVTKYNSRKWISSPRAVWY